jgi:S1-C subfamily serine protease
MDHQSVVRIYATTQSPDYQVPWQSQPPENSTGSGVVIGNGRILTGAHVVANATFLQVQKVSDPNKFVARVEAICHDADLALLAVDERGFMKGVAADKLGPLPKLRDRVSVVGYPIGGEEISITEGVVSRIEVQRYSHSERMLLAVTVDAAINDGNSGGPVYRNGKVAGIAFQSLKDAENIGEMVPASLIAKFLDGVGPRRRARALPQLEPRIPGLGVSTQNLENPLLRRRAGVKRNQSGVLVVSVEDGGASAGSIEVGDVISKVDGYSVANNGTVQYRGKRRTRFDVVLGDHFVGDRIEVGVLRAGKARRVELALAPFLSLVPRSQYDRPPSYFIHAGVVFQPLSLDLLRTWDHWWEKAPPEFLHAYYSGTRTVERHEVVVITQILADEINVGYEGLDYTTVRAVNGQAPRNITHFVELVEASGDTLEIVTSDHCRMAFDRAEAEEARARILDRYHVPGDRSADLA